MIVASRAIVVAVVDVRRDRICALAGIKALLLTQSFFKVSSRRPESKQSLPVLVLISRKRCLLLEQIAQQNRLLRVCVCLVAKSLLLGITGAFRCCELRSSFAQLPELRVHLKENLIPRVLRSESR